MNVKNKVITYVKIIVAMTFSFFLSYGLNETVFIADSPQLRKDSLGYISSLVQGAVSSGTRPDAVQKSVDGVVVHQVSRGVYAGERGTSSVRIYQVDEVHWKEYSYTTSDGKQVTIRVPQGEEPPPGVSEYTSLETD